MVESLVARLRDLHAGPKALPEVVALGDCAVPALEALLRASSESIPHRRWLAADALAAIGSRVATMALIRSLRDCSSRDLDPVALEAESLIVNRIAERLDRRSDLEVTEALLEAISRRPYANCARALGVRGEPRAIPLLVNCLYEDTVRLAALEALRHFREAAAPQLMAALAVRAARLGAEAPTHVDGRAAAATLLGALNGPEIQRVLLRALTDQEGQVRLAAALALASHQGVAARQAASVLMMALAGADWVQTLSITQALIRLGPQAESAVLAAIAHEPLNGTDRVRRVRAVGIAARLSLDSCIPVLARLHEAADANLRLAALGALSHHPSADSGCLLSFASDPNPIIRRKAVESLCIRGAIGPAEAMALLGDADPSIRTVIKRRLRQLGSDALPPVRSAVLTWGAPLHGWPRARLWLVALGFWLRVDLSGISHTKHSRRSPTRLH
jgi:HEAT repeat protein